MKNLAILLIISSILFSCKNGNPKSENTDYNAIINENSDKNELAISEESMNDIIQSLPSPLEIASKIKDSGVKFDEGLLNKTENADIYTGDSEKALALGIYAGDLGYINIYGKSYLAVTYLGSIKKIAEDLKIGQFFDFETIKRMGSNSNNLDSLLYLSTVSFEKMDKYLREQKRGKLSVLTVTGTWLESLHLATKVVEAKHDSSLVERIAEQKMILDQISLILSIYQSDEFITKLMTNLKLLKTEYDKVAITYIYKEPETKEVNGRLVIVDNSRTEVNINEEQLKQITIMVEKIREKVVLNTL
jgi:hypothetical protein